MIACIAPMVKWLSQQSSELLLWVRVLLGAHCKYMKIANDPKAIFFCSVLAGLSGGEGGGGGDFALSSRKAKVVTHKALIGARRGREIFQ